VSGELNGLLAVAACGSVVAAAEAVMIPLLRRAAIIDIPGPRSSHTVPTPRGGGIPIAAGLLVAAGVIGGAIAALFAFAVAAFGLLGFTEDMRGLAAGQGSYSGPGPPRPAPAGWNPAGSSSPPSGQAVTVRCGRTATTGSTSTCPPWGLAAKNIARSTVLTAPGEFTYRRVHRASRELLFDCLTQPEHLRHFWGAHRDHHPGRRHHRRLAAGRGLRDDHD
jgi:hypothetical protein